VSPIDVLVAELDHEAQSTRKLLEAVPADHLADKPAEKMFSVGDLAMHIASIMTWGYHTIATDDLNLTDFPNPESPTSPQQYLTHFDEGSKKFREALVGMAVEDMMTVWTLRTGDQVHMSMPRGVVLRGFVFNHLYHHRGQMTAFLRLLGAKVPGMYGPTADEMPNA